MPLNQIKINELIEHLIERANLEERTGFIVRGRFGIDAPKPITLQELGNRFSITRERVRQIETQAVAELRDGILSVSEVSAIFEFSRSYLRGAGGIRLDDHLVSDFYRHFKADDNTLAFGNRIRFIFKLLEYPYFSGESDLFRDFWYDDETHREKLSDIHGEIVSRLSRVEDFYDILKSVIAPRGINEATAASYLSVSKKIGVGPYGDIGLSDWEEINPKTVRAKAYLLLKKAGTPMHFTEIAKAIGSHAPTVHNELIKDPRFSLVNRGTYALNI